MPQFRLKVVVAGIVEIPDAHSEQPVAAFVQIGREVARVHVACQLVQNEVIHKAVHINPGGVAVFLTVIIVGVQRFFKIRKILTNLLFQFLAAVFLTGKFQLQRQCLVLNIGVLRKGT